MPRGPERQRRPRDVIDNAVMRIATGAIDDVITHDGKNAAAVALGRMGGKARAAGLSAKKRKAIAKKAAAVRWKSRRRAALRCRHRIHRPTSAVCSPSRLRHCYS